MNVQTIIYLHFTCQQGNAHNPSSQASAVCEPRTSRYVSWVQKRQRNQRSNCQHCWILDKAREFQKNIYFCFIDYSKAFDCVNQNCGKFLKRWEYQNTLLTLEKPVCRSRSNSQNQICNNRLVPNWERNTTRLYIVTLFI